MRRDKNAALGRHFYWIPDWDEGALLGGFAHHSVDGVDGGGITGHQMRDRGVHQALLFQNPFPSKLLGDNFDFEVAPTTAHACDCPVDGLFNCRFHLFLDRHAPSKISS